MGLASFPELADLVAADLYAGSALWRYPSFATSVLRMVYTLGPTGHGTLATFLRGTRVPTLLGFDPLFHFMHEQDVVNALVHDARQAAARRLQRRRAAAGAALDGDPRDGAHERPDPRDGLLDDARSLRLCRSCRQARSSTSSIPSPSTAARSRRRPASSTRSTRRARCAPTATPFRVRRTDRSRPGLAARRLAASACASPPARGMDRSTPTCPCSRGSSRRNLPATDPTRGGSASATDGPVLPFSKRPPPPDEYLLRSGDLEALPQEPRSIRTPAPQSYAPQSYAPQSYAPQSYAPPASQSYAPPSAFVRQAAPTPYGFTQQQQYGYRNDLSAPPPPHSLAPIAMSADSTNRQFSTTGASRAHSGTMIGREKPSLKWGIMIALSGALLGGVLGLGMDARRQSARAAAASEAKDAAPPAMVATALPVAPAAPPVVVAPRVAAPAALPVAANALTAPAVVAPPPVVAAPAPAPVVLAAAPAIVVPKTAAHPRAAVKPHGFLAAKVTPPPRRRARAQGRSARREDRGAQGCPEEGREHERRDEDPRSREQGHDEHALARLASLRAPRCGLPAIRLRRTALARRRHAR